MTRSISILLGGKCITFQTLFRVAITINFVALSAGLMFSLMTEYVLVSFGFPRTAADEQIATSCAFSIISKAPIVLLLSLNS